MSTQRFYFECPSHGVISWRSADDPYDDPVSCSVVTAGDGEPMLVRCDQPLTKRIMTFTHTVTARVALSKLRDDVLADLRGRYADPVDDWGHLVDAIMDTLAALDLLPDGLTLTVSTDDLPE